ncbi:aspartyl/asparaginyl beta-hydroxylase domain-containing protein [Rhodococcus sp. NPDC076796]|uniref:aspartyl/asparaginyl beta-hydroxylase domain-containing protein n=1 Tax=Rhodococcus sp. NPDC076796 TaxID=3154859 RepID=UPI00344C05A1
MGSRPLGQIDLDATSLNADLETDLATLDALDRPADLYDEFTIGSWVNHPLLNQSGVEADSTFRDGTGVRATPVLDQLPAIRAILDKYFHNERLMMARVRDVREWSIIPHRDFLELDSDNTRYFRILMTLQANDACMNSDESMVFRMRSGEVWFLDAAGVHSAIDTSSDTRWSLCPTR